MATPLAPLKSRPDAAGFLTDGASFDDLERMAAARTGLQAATTTAPRGALGER